MDKTFNLETLCVHGAYHAKDGEPQVMPLVQSTTYRFQDPQDVADLFDLKSLGSFYARIGSPTVDNFEKKMALLEGGTAAVATSSGRRPS